MKTGIKILGAVLGLLILCGTFLAPCAAQIVYANEESNDETTGETEEMLLNLFSFDEIDESLKDLFPDERIDFKEILTETLNGELTLTSELFNKLVRDLLGYAWNSSRKNLIHIILIALIAAVFSNFTKIFQSKQVADISFYVSYLLIIALTLSTFGLMIDWVTEGIEKLTSYMSVFCPLYFLAVSIAKGSVTSVAFYNLVLFFIYLVELLVLKFLLPLIHIYMMMKVLNYLSEEDYLSKFSELIEMAVEWVLKTLLACVVGLNIVQGLISPAIDTIKQSTLTRSAEAIPGVGDALGGMAEVVLATAVLIKNGIGMTGAVICFALCLIPLVQIALVTFLYKLAAAMLQPVSDKRIVECIEAVGEGCRLLMRVVFTTGLLFLITIAIVAVLTNQV